MRVDELSPFDFSYDDYSMATVDANPDIGGVTILPTNQNQVRDTTTDWGSVISNLGSLGVTLTSLALDKQTPAAAQQTKVIAAQNSNKLATILILAGAAVVITWIVVH